MVTETILSDDNERRFLIHKTWDSKLPSLAIIMLNPTPSESVTIDHTTLYILNNCVELGFGSVSILNLFSTINNACEALSELDSDKVDYFQVFRLKRKLIESEIHQEITIEQENPPRQHTTYFPFSDAVNCTVFCIDAEEYHTYMLSSEY
jgi:hypothetical protein